MNIDKNIYIIFGGTYRVDGENIYGVFSTLKAAKEKNRLNETVGWTTFHIE